MTNKFPNAVFIHLGKSPARHLWINLDRHLRMFPEINPTVIIDHESHRNHVPKNVKIYVYRRKLKLLSREFLLAHDLNFRRGFWRFSLERFLAFYEYHQEYPNHSMLHIESDMLLMPNFPWILFEKIHKPMWSNYNEERDVAALLFFPSLVSHEKFIYHLTSLLRNNPLHTDMTILREIRIKRMKNEVDLFPSLSCRVPELINNLNKSSGGALNPVMNNEVFFEGVFDSAAIGMWLIGHDPRNYYGMTRIHDNSPIINGDSLVDPTRIVFKKTNSEVWISSPTTNQQINLWSIHVHSKSLKVFNSNWSHELDKYILMSKSKNIFKSFNVGVLIEMMIESIKSKTLHKFIYGIPFVQKLRYTLHVVKKFTLKWLRCVGFSKEN